MRFRLVALIATASTVLTACLGEEEILTILEPTDRVNVTAGAASLAPGETVQLNVSLVGKNGRTLDPGRRQAVQWLSRDPSIATVSATGVVTAVAPGNVVIEARQSDVLGTVSLRVDDPCARVTPFTLGSNVNGQLTQFDCSISGARADLYSFSIAGGAGDFTFVLNSTAFTPLFALETTGAQGQVIAVGTQGASAAISQARVFLAPGEFRITARSFSANQFGNYTLSSSSSAGGPITNCQAPWLMRGLQVSEQIATTDCRDQVAGGNLYYDQYFFVLNAGQSATFTMRSTAVDAYLAVRALDGSVMNNCPSSTSPPRCEDDDSGGGVNGQDARLTFTAPRSDAFIVDARTFPLVPNAVGNYTIVMQ